MMLAFLFVVVDCFAFYNIYINIYSKLLSNNADLLSFEIQHKWFQAEYILYIYIYIWLGTDLTLSFCIFG